MPLCAFVTERAGVQLRPQSKPAGTDLPCTCSHTAVCDPSLPF